MSALGYVRTIIHATPMERGGAVYGCRVMEACMPSFQSRVSRPTLAGQGPTCGEAFLVVASARPFQYELGVDADVEPRQAAAVVPGLPPRRRARPA